MSKTSQISISGQVQGVGFRPYVYGLANAYSLKGTVSNNENGVRIIVTGAKVHIQNFYEELLNCPPPVSKIVSSYIEDIETIDFDDFQIIPSATNGQLNVSLTPDFAICKECQDEITNTSNRRYGYPFTTCVHCGPRWAITESFPFERAHTSIDKFPMCKDCLEEYTNPLNRRFHSQTNTCPSCGIQIQLIDNKNTKINIPQKLIFRELARLLQDGKIIALKNTSGYLLCCNAENEQAIKKLRNVKNRPSKPFAVLYPSMEMLQEDISLTKNQKQLLLASERPITILSLESYKGKIALNLVAPGLKQLGVMLPYSGILQLLANELTFPVVATSGNIHGSPIIHSNEQALDKLSTVADYFLVHNLKILHPQDDSVVKFSTVQQKEVIFRRSRGYAPNFFKSNIRTSEKIMAMGGHLKSSIAFIPNEYIYISQYLGNLDNYDVFERFCKTADNFIKIFDQLPETILIDTHPNYQSTRYGKELAQKLEIPYVEIPHHGAHFAAILGEHKLFDSKDNILGVIWDGTGYGDDGQIWGGEFFNYQSHKLNRLHHLEYFNWLLGDKMSQEPRLSLLSLASESMTPVLEKKFTKHELENYKTLLAINTLKTSSMGRLFDAVASLLDITDENSYEGEAPILLENSINSYGLDSCISYLEDAAHSFDPKEIIQNIYLDLQSEVPKHQIISNFFFTLANSIVTIANKHGYKHIACSGGVFQNTSLIDMLMELAPKQIKLYFHKDLAPNDENISFGQLHYYLHIKD